MTYLFRLCPRALWQSRASSWWGWVVRHLMRQLQDGSGHSEDEWYVQARILSTWMPEHQNEHFSMSFSNQYLTPAWFANGESPCTINPTIDPMASCNKPQWCSMAFTSRTTASCIMSNFVKMGEYSPEICLTPACLLTYSCSKSEYIKVNPSIVRPGQIIQLQFAVETIAMSHSHPGTVNFQVSAKLRSLCILDRSIQEVSLNHWLYGLQINNLFTYRNSNYL